MKLLDEEMDGVAREQRERLQTIDEELEDVKRRLGRIWQAIETTDIEMADASEPHQGAPGAQGEAGDSRRGGREGC